MSARNRHESDSSVMALLRWSAEDRRTANDLAELCTVLAERPLYGRPASPILLDEADPPLLGVGLSRAEVLAAFGVPERLMDPPPAVLKGYDEPPPFPAALDPRRRR